MGETIRCDVAVIGAGTAGLAAWRAADKRGKHAVIIERGPGGTTCARVGCMPSKLMLAAARAAREARRSDLFGVRTGSVEIDGAAVLARMRNERDRFTAGACENWFAIPPEQRIDGTARFTGPTTLQVEDGPTVEADAVVIAVGSSPIVPPVLDPVAERVRTFETLFDIEALPKRMAVIGAGALGLELAQAFALLDVAVTVIDDGPAPGKLTDPEAVAVARAAFESRLDLHLETEVQEAAMTDDGARLRWDGGEGVFDLVLAASGVKPDLKPLDLEAAGIELDDRGTPLFDAATRRCGDAPVFVAGDAGGDRPVLHEASREGEMAGIGAAGGRARPRLPKLAMTFTDPEMVLVGCDHDDLPDGARIGTERFEENGRVRIEEGPEADGIARVYADPDGKLIGGTLVGPQSEHLGHMLALAVSQGMTADALADAAFYHPCVEETLQNAVRDLLRD